jgi:endonuclease/exonuclease/phosphatase family metal-dependent hydrolase
MMSSPATGLTVTTWNLNGARGVHIDAVVAHVRAMGTDLLALQEVQRHQARALAKALEATSLAWSFKHWPVKTWPEGMALVGLTRPVRNVRVRALTARWRVSTWRRRIVQVADLAVSDAETLRLVNVHLSPHPEG